LRNGIGRIALLMTAAWVTGCGDSGNPPSPSSPGTGETHSAPKSKPSATGATPVEQIIALLVNEAREKAKAPALKSNPILTEEARKLVEQFVKDGKRSALFSFQEDAPALMQALKDKGYDAKAVKTSIKVGSFNTGLPELLRKSDTDRTLATGDWTDVGGAQGPILQGQEFYVIIYARSAGASGPAGSGTYPDASTPEGAVRTFLAAMATGDQPTLRNVVQETSDFEWLTKGEKPPAGVVAEMRSTIMETPIRSLKPGDKVALPKGRSVTVASQEVGPADAVIWPDGAPTPFRVKKVGDHWRVDASPMIASRKAADAARKKR
jgi:predicted small lipoprotein YifL